MTVSRGTDTNDKKIAASAEYKAMKKAGEHFCYIARMLDQPGAYAMCSEAPEYAPHAAQFCSEEIKRGGTIERVGIEKAKTMLKEWMAWKDAQ